MVSLLSLSFGNLGFAGIMARRRRLVNRVGRVVTGWLTL